MRICLASLTSRSRVHYLFEKRTVHNYDKLPIFLRNQQRLTMSSQVPCYGSKEANELLGAHDWVDSEHKNIPEKYAFKTYLSSFSARSCAAFCG